MHDFYYQVHQLDGRIENQHLCLNDVDIFLDLMNEIRPKTKKVIGISIVQWNMERTTKGANKVDIHRDLYEENDAEGECVGFIEHYEI